VTTPNPRPPAAEATKGPIENARFAARLKPCPDGERRLSHRLLGRGLFVHSLLTRARRTPARNLTLQIQDFRSVPPAGVESKIADSRFQINSQGASSGDDTGQQPLRTRDGKPQRKPSADGFPRATPFKGRRSALASMPDNSLREIADPTNQGPAPARLIERNSGALPRRD
jgi:hypothetical protein